jgi:hypothetical protein
MRCGEEESVDDEAGEVVEAGGLEGSIPCAVEGGTEAEEDVFDRGVYV